LAAPSRIYCAEFQQLERFYSAYLLMNIQLRTGRGKRKDDDFILENF
jgi:hypothetical protein